MIEIIIPAFNCSKTIEKTLASLMMQTDQRFKVTVVDDCSTEDIKPIVDYYRSHLDINYIRHDINMGCGMSRQTGIDNASCRFITFLDSDDMFMPYTVEVFNSVVEAKPETEYLHTYFYEQAVINDVPILYLHKNNFTACHGKLYNVDKLREYEIHNSPTVRWADDSFYNSMCGELLKMDVLNIPMMLWTNNPNSVMRCENDERDRLRKIDFFDAMILSTEFVLQKKGKVDHLQNTLENILKNDALTDVEQEKLNILLKMSKGD